jgi:IclR family KDG regulon transcriptional repressor
MPKSAVRVLDIFELLACFPNGLTFTQIQERLGFPKSSLSALLQVLEARSYVETDSANRYKLGLRLMELGNVHVGTRDLIEVVEPTMRIIRDLTGETVNLAILDGGDVVFLHKKLAASALRYDTAVGSRMPAYLTSVGKAMISTLSDNEIDGLFSHEGLVTYTPNSLPNVSALKAELREIRRKGFATDHEEGLLGVCAVGSPIRDGSGHVVAGLSIAYPKARGSDEIERKLAEIVNAGALIISASLGYASGSQAIGNHSLKDIWAGIRSNSIRPEP